MSATLAIGLTVGAVVLAAVVILAMRGGGNSGPTTSKACGGCKRAMLPAWTKCPFCNWQPSARLEFIHGPVAGTVLELTGDVTTLGSGDGNTVVLADPHVSRKHAGIRRDAAGNYELADFGSSNGVYVNGHRLPKAVLAPGDVLRVGATEAIFRM